MLSIIFWALIISSIVLSVIGVYRNKPAYLITAAVLCLGYSWYFALVPRLVFKLFGFAAPVFYLGAAHVLRKYSGKFAWPLIIPHILVFVYLNEQFRNLMLYISSLLTAGK